MMVDASDIITTQSWKNVCQYIYDAPDLDNVPQGGIVWVALDQIQEFFKRISGTGRSYIVVSSHSDFGLVEQSKHPVWVDLIKQCKRIVLTNGSNLGYGSVTVPAPCRRHNCRLSDRYSIKSYSWTHATLSQIPTEVKAWFLPNNEVGDRRLINIPFGIADGTQELFANLETKAKDKLLYVNFQCHTPERLELKCYYRGVAGSWLTVKETVSLKEYIANLRNHQFVLCPPGNGFDSYRVLETLYCGSIPIVESNPAMLRLGLPVVAMPFHKMCSLSVYDMHDLLLAPPGDVSKIKLSYWRERINELYKEIF